MFFRFQFLQYFDRKLFSSALLFKINSPKLSFTACCSLSKSIASKHSLVFFIFSFLSSLKRRNFDQENFSYCAVMRNIQRVINSVEFYIVQWNLLRIGNQSNARDNKKVSLKVIFKFQFERFMPSNGQTLKAFICSWTKPVVKRLVAWRIVLWFMETTKNQFVSILNEKISFISPINMKHTLFIVSQPLSSCIASID